MKQQKQIQYWFAALAAGMALAASSSLCAAADISYTFDSDVQGWYAADAHGNVVWDETHGRAGGGCLKYTIVAASDTEIDPRVDVAFDTTGYFSVEFDIMVDPTSGMDANGSYGNLQIIARDATWSWDSMWFGGVGTSFNTYQHVKRAFTSAYGLKAYLQLQFAAAAAPYASDVIVYIDNVVVRNGTPPNEAVIHDFAWPESVIMGVGSWSSGIVVSHDTTVATNGALKFTASYPGSGGWQEADVQLSPYDWEPSKFTWLEFDLYVDAPTGLGGGYSGLNVFEITSSWGWTSIGWNDVTTANIGTWTHYKRVISSMTASHGIIFQAGCGATVPATVAYYIDNIKVWKPSTPPSITTIEKDPGIGGVQVKMGSSGNWERNAIVTPSGMPPLTWVSQTPITYSMTITNFPDATKHASFEAHIYLVNGDTVANNETSGSADWNAADIMILNVQNNTNGGVNFALGWKTNYPAANPTNYPARINDLPSALGTWSVTFTNDFAGIISGPGGVSTNFTLPEDVPMSNFNPANMFVQFGAFEGTDTTRNDLQSATFSHVLITNAFGTVIEDNFAGPGLTAANAWRTTSSTAVQWIAPATALWLTWTTPDVGYIMEVAGNMAGPYTDAGVTLVIPNGANKVGAVPATSIPAGNAAFFRMRKPLP
jgi:hypothetical protein